MRAKTNGKSLAPGSGGFISSIIDRLMDDDPESINDAADLKRVNIFLFKAAIARDLECLLNSRCIDIDNTLADYSLAKNSVIAYGIQDFSSLSLLDPNHRALLRDQIRKTIERFEPRLNRIRVTLETSRNHERKLRFRVDAVLRIHPARPPVTFDAWLHLASAQYKFNEQR